MPLPACKYGGLRLMLLHPAVQLAITLVYLLPGLGWVARPRLLGEFHG